MRKGILKRYIIDSEIAKHVYIDKVFSKRKESIAIYRSKHSHTYRAMVDKKRMSGYGIEFVTLLIHWNDSQEETRNVSKKIYEYLSSAKEENGIKLLQPLVPEPVDVGADNNGIFEMVIEVAIVYKRWWNKAKTKTKR